MPDREPSWNFKFTPETGPNSDQPLKLSWNVYTPTQVLSDAKPVTPELSKLASVESETIRLNNGIFVRVPSADKKMLSGCQDAGAVALDEHGNISAFSLADGISKAINSKAVAEQAVKFAINELRNRLSSGEMSQEDMKTLLLGVEDRMQVADIAGLKDSWAHAMVEQGASVFTLAQFGYTNVNGQLEKITQSESQNDGLGSTTLMMGIIENGMLRIANVGDGGFMVIKTDGKKIIYEGQAIKGTPSQLSITGSRIATAEIYLAEVPLAVGDVVLAYTDGLSRQISGKKILAEERVADVTRGLQARQTLEDIIKGLLLKAGGSDDATVVGFEYRG